MWLRCPVMALLASLAATSAVADHRLQSRKPDAAGLVQGDWVMVAVEHEGIVSEQIESRAERILGERWQFMYDIPEKRNEASLRAVPPVLPPETPVYRFSGGRVAIWEDLKPGKQGTYRFDGTRRRPILEVTWKDEFGRLDTYRFLYQFSDDTMAWCCDTKKQGGLPAEFAATKPEHYILTFRRLKS